MKKIILVALIFILTGCFEDSGYITKSCIKKEKANNLNTTVVYTFKFKNDIIEKLVVNYDYIDTDINTINSIKLSNETQNKYLQELNHKVLIDEANHYQIEYYLDNNNSDEIKQKFNFKEKRSELVELLESEYFVCE